MLYFAIKAALSGIIVATVSEVARRSPGAGALIASLPLISVFGMIWLWRDTAPAKRAKEIGAPSLKLPLLASSPQVSPLRRWRIHNERNAGLSNDNRRALSCWH